MEKVIFRNLLVDLYKIYNPDNVQYVDGLVEKYSRHEFDAVQNIFIKYNYKSAPYYDSEIGTDKYISDLIKEYDADLRSLENINLKEQFNGKTEALEQKTKFEEIKKIETIQKEVKDEVSGEVNKKLQTLEDSFAKKELAHKNALDTIYNDFQKKIEMLKQDNDDITIRVFSLYTNSELVLPNKKEISRLGKGCRLILKDENDKTIGLEIKDIVYDCVSELSGKPLIEIWVDKA